MRTSWTTVNARWGQHTEHSATFFLKSDMWRASKGHITEPSRWGTCEQLQWRGGRAARHWMPLLVNPPPLSQTIEGRIQTTPLSAWKHVKCASCWPTWIQRCSVPSVPPILFLCRCHDKKGKDNVCLTETYGLSFSWHPKSSWYSKLRGLDRPRVSTWREHSQFLRPGSTQNSVCFRSLFNLSCKSCAAFSRHDEQPCSRPAEQRDSRSCLQVKGSSDRTMQKTTSRVTSAGPSSTLWRPSTLRFSGGCNRTTWSLNMVSWPLMVIGSFIVTCLFRSPRTSLSLKSGNTAENFDSQRFNLDRVFTIPEVQVIKLWFRTASTAPRPTSSSSSH